jgi:hypothetical protein
MPFVWNPLFPQWFCIATWWVLHHNLDWLLHFNSMSFISQLLWAFASKLLWLLSAKLCFILWDCIAIQIAFNASNSKAVTPELLCHSCCKLLYYLHLNCCYINTGNYYSFYTWIAVIFILEIIMCLHRSFMICSQ